MEEVFTALRNSGWFYQSYLWIEGNYAELFSATFSIYFVGKWVICGNPPPIIKKILEHSKG
jgi:hypothetical protein